MSAVKVSQGADDSDDDAVLSESSSDGDDESPDTRQSSGEGSTLHKIIVGVDFGTTYTGRSPTKV